MPPWRLMALLVFMRLWQVWSMLMLWSLFAWSRSSWWRAFLVVKAAVKQEIEKDINIFRDFFFLIANFNSLKEILVTASNWFLYNIISYYLYKNIQNMLTQIYNLLLSKQWKNKVGLENHYSRVKALNEYVNCKELSNSMYFTIWTDLLTPSWWLTCSRVRFILLWQFLMLSTSRIKEFSTPSFTTSIPFRPSLNNAMRVIPVEFKLSCEIFSPHAAGPGFRLSGFLHP